MKNLIGITLVFGFCCLLPARAQAADYYDWSVRTDRDGKPAGVYGITPFPIDETMSSFSITNDEGTKIFYLGTICFLDNSAGIINGATNYNPVTRTCGSGGAYTVFTNITSALNALGYGNKTLLVRAGTYTVSGISFSTHYGDDNNHRFSIIGYKQERPVFDGGYSSQNMFGGTGRADFYATLQRLRFQNNITHGIQIGNDDRNTKVSRFVNLIDIHFYQCAYSAHAVTGTHTGANGSTLLIDNTKNWTPNQWAGAATYFTLMNVTKQAVDTLGKYYRAIQSNDATSITTDSGLTWDTGDIYYIGFQNSGPVYFMNADNGWVFHCTMEKTDGHGIKVGDGASNTIVEWNDIKDIGYWPDMPLKYHLGRTVGIDFPTDPPANILSENNIARYNVLKGCGSEGMQLRGQHNFVAHHNDISGWGAFANTIGYIGGVNPHGILLENNYNSGTWYSNIIHDPDINNKATYYLGVYVGNSQNSVVNFYNNLFYGQIIANGDPRHNINMSSTCTRNFYNNTVIGANNNAGSYYSLYFDDATGTATVRNNIFWQTGIGRTVRYGDGTTHSNNLYYYPSGSVGNPLPEAGAVNGQNPGFTLNPSGAYVFDMGNIKTDSFAKNAGADLSPLFTTDFNLTPRPQEGAWDIGAYEYIPAQPQTWTLNAGWNWISFNVLPADLSLNSVFSTILTQVEQAKTQTQSAIRSAGNWKGDLADMNGIGQYKMYKVKVSANCILTVTGTAVPSATPIHLGGGWNWVAYLPTTSMSITTALTSINTQVQAVKSLTQSATYNGTSWSSTFDMQPGQGYAIKMSAPGTLTYPAEVSMNLSNKMVKND
jgi:hypothetical protein